MSKIAVYPGSFDPITNGHLDIIHRSSKIFDKLIVAVIENPEKKNTLFSIEEKMDLIRRSIPNIKNIEVESFIGLTVNYLQKRKANIIVRGLRAVSDFEFELQLASINNKLDSGIETLFMMTNSEYFYLSSMWVRQVAMYGGSLKGLVPDEIIPDIERKYSNSWEK